MTGLATEGFYILEDIVIKRPCTHCQGTGRVFDFLGVILNPANWIPFTWPKNPYVRCPACYGKGYYWKEWRDRGRR